MAEQGVRHLDVRENHKIVGVLSIRDLVKMVSFPGTGHGSLARHRQR